MGNSFRTSLTNIADFGLNLKRQIKILSGCMVWKTLIFPDKILDSPYHNRYVTGVANIRKKVFVQFFINDRGKEPVRDWLLGFSAEDKKIIGEDIKTVEFGWPIGMPTVRPMGGKLYEVRSDLSDGSDVRVFFTIYKKYLVLLHGYIKKSRKTPKRDLNLATNRMRKFYN